jgi:hypothetical protein
MCCHGKIYHIERRFSRGKLCHAAKELDLQKYKIVAIIIKISNKKIKKIKISNSSQAASFLIRILKIDSNTKNPNIIFRSRKNISRSFLGPKNEKNVQKNLQIFHNFVISV